MAIAPAVIHGQRLRLAAAIWTEATDVGSGALLYLQFLPKTDEDESEFFDAPIAPATSSAEPVLSPQWTTIAVETDVPERADLFVLGLFMTGNGTACFGDLGFTEIVRSD